MLDYFSKKISLTQSPQLYKQIMVGVFDKIYEIGKVYRGDKSNTNKHLVEFTGLDVEIANVTSVDELIEIETGLLRYIVENLNSYSPSFKIITYSEALSLFEKLTSKKQNNINSEIELTIGNHFLKNEIEFIFIKNYPDSERAFYTNGIENFDLLYNGVEITSGSIRINKYTELINNVESLNLNKEELQFYLDQFKFDMPVHGGFGIVLERFIKQNMNIQDISDCAIIPKTSNFIKY